MRVHFYTFSDEKGGSSRQRAFRVAEELNKRGMSAVIQGPPVVELSLTPWPKKLRLIFRVLRTLPSIKKGDVVYLQRTTYNKYFFAVMVTYLLISRRRMIFDFDDPIYIHSYLKTKIFTQLADAVVVCTHVQAQWAKQFNTNVHVVHIALNHKEYEKFEKNYTLPAAGRPVIGWVGSGPEHLRNLEVLADVLRTLVTSAPPFKFVLVGAVKDMRVHALFESVPGLDAELIDSLDWKNPQSVPRKIQTFDIGVVPHQTEGVWNKAKTSMKVLEYMACAVPPVVSNFGEMPHIIEDGVNGFLVESKEEWVSKLSLLLSDPALRERLGRAGQERVAREFCFDAIVPRLMGIISGPVRAPSPQRP